MNLEREAEGRSWPRSLECLEAGVSLNSRCTVQGLSKMNTGDTQASIFI